MRDFRKRLLFVKTILSLQHTIMIQTQTGQLNSVHMHTNSAAHAAQTCAASSWEQRRCFWRCWSKIHRQRHAASTMKQSRATSTSTTNRARPDVNCSDAILQSAAAGRAREGTAKKAHLKPNNDTTAPWRGSRMGGRGHLPRPIGPVVTPVGLSAQPQ